MKALLKSLFSEESGISMMRVMSLLSLIAGIILAYNNKPGYEVLILAAFSGKAGQKFLEMKQLNSGGAIKNGPDAK
jgi:hypothetical protein